MLLKRTVTIALIIHQATKVYGCSLRRPCGIIAADIQLTNVPGILHVIFNKYQDCNAIEPSSWERIDQTKVEVDTKTDSVRTSDDKNWKASPIRNVGVMSLPTVDQSRFDVKFKHNSQKITLVDNNNEQMQFEFNLEGFVAPLQPTEFAGIISFYSDAMQRLYVIYPKKGDKTAIASCNVQHKSCVYNDTNLDFDSVKRNSKEIKVHDSIQLVSLPLLDDLCTSQKYYVFDKDTIVKSVDTLSDLDAYEIDHRLGTAYSIKGDYGTKLKVHTEGIVDNNIPVSSKMTKTIRVKKGKLAKSFQSYTTTNIF